MRKIFIIISALLLVTKVCIEAKAFSENSNESGFEAVINYQVDSIVNTPFGPALKSNVHYIDSKHYLKKKDSYIQVINRNTGEIIQQFDNSQNTDTRTLIGKSAGGSGFQESPPQTNSDNGWITHAECSIFGLNPPIITRFSADWVVPSPPIKKSSQLLYLFIGLSTIENGMAHIVQPVLQWGLSPAGGGKYWAICNWYVSSNLQFFYDSLIQVNTGTQLQGNIELTAVSENKYNYKSSFTGYSLGLNVNNIPRLYDPTVALEAYNVTDCDEYPLDERIRVSKINILFGGELPYFVWLNYDAKNSCNQYTNVINPSLENGEIHIHFHTPTAIENFDDFHVYPNPFIDFLHISPAMQINHCKIEVYNSLGVLIHSEFHSNPDYEFNLNFQGFPAGLYFIKFNYNITKTHTLRVIKTGG